MTTETTKHVLYALNVLLQAMRHCASNQRCH